MSPFKYILEPYSGPSSRYQCPKCGQREKTFTRYMDPKTEKYIASTVGRCTRENSCGYHYTPKDFFRDQDNLELQLKLPVIKPNTYTTIPVDQFKASLTNYEQNNFIKVLLRQFGPNVTEELIGKYFIGTSDKWDGATIFWQIDMDGKIRTGKIMLYNPTTGKRVKEPYPHISWAHSGFKRTDFKLKQCLFGEHLLKDKEKIIALVESEKTAIISSVFFPDLIWLAVGSLNNLNATICHSLKGRKFILFPDLKGYEKWDEKLKELSLSTTSSISRLLEKVATEKEKEQGLDLADYLLRFDLHDFLKEGNNDSDNLVAISSQIECQEESNEIFNTDDKNHPDGYLFNKNNWDDDIQELEGFFNSICLPTTPLTIRPDYIIGNVYKYVTDEMYLVKIQNGKKGYLPYLCHLKDLKDFIVGNPDFWDKPDYLSVKET